MQMINSKFVVTAETTFENSEAYYIIMELMRDRDLRSFKH